METVLKITQHGKTFERTLLFHLVAGGKLLTFRFCEFLEVCRSAKTVKIARLQKMCILQIFIFLLTSLKNFVVLIYLQSGKDWLKMRPFLPHPFTIPLLKCFHCKLESSNFNRSRLGKVLGAFKFSCVVIFNW